MPPYAEMHAGTVAIAPSFPKAAGLQATRSRTSASDKGDARKRTGRKRPTCRHSWVR